jgi:hypothetical protein
MANITITRSSGHLWTGGEVVTPAKLNEAVSKMRATAPPLSLAGVPAQVVEEGEEQPESGEVVALPASALFLSLLELATAQAFRQAIGADSGNILTPGGTAELAADLDEATGFGYFRTGAGTLNRPAGADVWLVQAVPVAEDAVFQFATRPEGGGGDTGAGARSLVIFFRAKIAGVWSAWSRFSDEAPVDGQYYAKMDGAWAALGGLATRQIFTNEDSADGYPDASLGEEGDLWLRSE